MSGAFCYRIVASQNQESMSNIRADDTNNGQTNIIDFTFSMDVEGSVIQSSEAKAVPSSDLVTVMQGISKSVFIYDKVSFNNTLE